MKFQELVALMPWTIILQIGNLLLQMYLFKRFLLKPVQDILARRQAEVNGQLDAAAQAQLEAEQAKTEYNRQLEGAREEAAAVVRQAAQNARSSSEELLRQARQDASQLREKAEAEIERQRRNAVNEIKKDLSGMAVAIASKVVEKEIDEKTHEDLIQTFIDQMGEAV